MTQNKKPSTRKSVLPPPHRVDLFGYRMNGPQTLREWAHYQHMTEDYHQHDWRIPRVGIAWPHNCLETREAFPSAEAMSRTYGTVGRDERESRQAKRKGPRLLHLGPGFSPVSRKTVYSDLRRLSQPVTPAPRPTRRTAPGAGTAAEVVTIWRPSKNTFVNVPALTVPSRSTRQ